MEIGYVLETNIRDGRKLQRSDSDLSKGKSETWNLREGSFLSGKRLTLRHLYR
jgi:hypothetical protein